jgi:hypothetical protein
MAENSFVIFGVFVVQFLARRELSQVSESQVSKVEALAARIPDV